MKLKAYYQLSKPGIVYGNLLTAVAGYFLASNLHIRVSFWGMLVGTAFVMASACTINNLFDRDIDKKMTRTKARPSVNGQINFKPALIYSLVLLITGSSLLFILTNTLTVVIGVIGFIDYAFIYTYYKRKTYHATLIGTIAGAAPIVGGYVAYSGRITIASLILGIMMLVWQMPHFFSIAIYRQKEYSMAGIPVMPITLGRRITSYWMMFYSFVFLVASILLYFFAPVGYIYLVIMALTGMGWLIFNLRVLFTANIESWAKKNFRYSLIVMMIMTAAVVFR